MVSGPRDIVALGLLACSCLAASSCGGRDDLGLVNGSVKLDGQPLPDAFVEFVPRGPGSTSIGRTDENGDYSLMFSREVEGATIGESLVRITTYDMSVDEVGTVVPLVEKVPAKYNQDTELLVTVASGANCFDFDLQTAGAEIIQPTISGDEPPDYLGTVRGTVTLDGAPLAHASIEFIPTGGVASPSSGRTDASGDYCLMYTCCEEGAAIGETLVRITKQESLDQGSLSDLEAHVAVADAIVDTELTVTVASGSNRFDLDLKTVDGQIVLTE